MKLSAIIVTAFFMLLPVQGCTPAGTLTDSGSGEPDGDAPAYTIIYLVHGDSDYLYHESGKPVRADRSVLDKATAVAAEASAGDVFIFHQRRQRSLLGVIPLQRSRMLHYRNGERIAGRRYSAGSVEGRDPLFHAEAEMVRQSQEAAGSGPGPFVLLYYGHEIPETDGKGYHRSRPETDVNIRSFAAGMGRFTPPGRERMDLLVLSTCSNGTPGMVRLLKPYTDVLLASPQLLHLSHMDSEPLLMLERNAALQPVVLAEAMAEQTFRRLSGFLQTSITLSVYDMNRLGGNLPEAGLRPAAAPAETENQEVSGAVQGAARNGSGSVRSTGEIADCADVLSLEPDQFPEGVRTWFRSARFGRDAGKTDHSGWGCRRERLSGR